ncbi:MAG: serine/threonine-protein kinase [Polyangiaceae bacterium]
MTHASSPPDRKGEVIGGRYKILGELGRGGQGAVYRARDLRDGDEVAVKVLSVPAQREDEWRERMLREAHALTVLSTTAAVRIVHQAWADDGSFCLVTELLQGVDLQDYLEAREARGERMEIPALIELLGPVVATLESAHAAGILHRDLKPRNIFVLDSGGVRLLDFGFAKFTRMRRLTQAGLIAGSPSYIAPEIWSGASHFDHRIDVYSFGALLFRALGAQTPFSGEGMQEILRIVTTAERPSLHALRPDLPAAIDDWVQHALAIEPEHRFERVQAMWNALKGLGAAQTPVEP